MRFSRTWTLALVGAAGVASSAMAGMTGGAITITAEANGKTALWSMPESAAPWGADMWNWRLTQPIEFRADDGELLGTVKGLNIGYIADPVISMSFSVLAGNALTHFTITSAQLNFPVINSAIARASGAITVTDGNGDGGSFTGLYAGGKSFTAHYNGLVGGAGTDFATLVTGKSVGSFASDTSSESQPAVGYQATGANISSMQSQVDFQVTANDLASGTTVFVVVPGPGVASVGVLAGIAAIRRRRR